MGGNNPTVLCFWLDSREMSNPSIVRLPFFFFFLYSYTCFQEMFPKEKLLADFILRTECAFTTVESLNVSMFRLTPPVIMFWLNLC